MESGRRTLTLMGTRVVNAEEPVPSRKRFSRRAIVAAALLVSLGSGYALWQQEKPPEFLHASESDFVALFNPPPAADSPQTRGELDELLAMQQRRTPQEAEAAYADRKTEIRQFATALGLHTDQVREMDALSRLAEQIEDDVRPYVRAAKHRFLRLRPYEIEPRIKPCIDNVRGDLSYPSGHSTYGYVMANLLSDMVPERRSQLMARAQQFAQQRAVCGVHFPSDLEAGRVGAEWLTQKFLASPDYQAAGRPKREPSGLRDGGCAKRARRCYRLARPRHSPASSVATARFRNCWISLARSRLVTVTGRGWHRQDAHRRRSGAAHRYHRAARRVLGGTAVRSAAPSC